ncbi:hypothetical protein ACFE04_022364 [Oxalis oulophora]
MELIHFFSTFAPAIKGTLQITKFRDLVILETVVECDQSISPHVLNRSFRRCILSTSPTDTVPREDFLFLNKSNPKLGNFSTSFALVVLLDVFIVENDICLVLFPTDTGDDDDLVGDNAHCDVALPYPMSETGFFIALFITSLGEISTEIG